MRKVVYSLLLLGLLGCNGLKSIKQAFTDTSPYEKYVKSLETASLHNTVMYRQWAEAGKSALKDSIFIKAPFSESGYFAAGEPEAMGYRFQATEGQVVNIKCEVKTSPESRLFLDLFVEENGEWERLVSADSTLSLQHEFDEDRTCLLRLQPALLVNAYYQIDITKKPALDNPVLGATNRSIRSFYGNPRDGGRRSHEGVDIFASRGTPVVAPTEGYISRVGTNNLGGKVVWMRDSKRGHSYYFAHLDSQLVSSGNKVKKGDTLGLVGNTGNAITTAPHLHFGIYQSGSKDPLNYIFNIPKVELDSSPDTSYFNQAFKIGVPQANLRQGPGTDFEIQERLSENSYVKIIGQSSDWYRVLLPDDNHYFVFKTLVTPLNDNNSIQLTSPTYLLSSASDKAVPKGYLTDSTTISVLAEYKDYRYISTSSGNYGWIASVSE